MTLILDATPSLDLEIRGSVGEFKVRPHDAERSSIPVRFIQTHIRFTREGDQQEKLFMNLLPVRELFEPADLSFEELMQRDLDDSRVSMQLIPYLLRIGAGDSVKFFPPIITVVVPVDHNNNLLDYFPRVTHRKDDGPQEDTYRHLIRSGEAGREVFEFEQLEVHGKTQEFDYAKLKVNTASSKIVIIDGQHRAMALLALYRNIKGWPDKTASYQDFYKKWTKGRLEEFNLKNITLPLVVCVLPELHVDGERKTKVAQACRSIFLALNKNARPVSTARNILLDDYDVIAHFERLVLEQIKSFDINSATPLRISNFELDQTENKQRLQSTIAISGVIHLYTILERVLLGNHSISGLSYPVQRYDLVKHIGPTCLRRLDGPNLLGEELLDRIRRDAVPDKAMEVLSESFERLYMKHIVEGFCKFWPFEATANAALELRQELRDKNEKHIESMLFEGQGIQKVFEDYIEQLDRDLHGDENTVAPPEQVRILKDFKARQVRLLEFQASFQDMRARAYLPHLAESRFCDAIRASVRQLFDYNFTTTAFQVALFFTFFDMIEELNREQGATLRGGPDEARFFEEYLSSLNRFFRPQSDAEVKALFSTFCGNVSGTFGSENMTVSKSDYTFRSIVIPNHLKPDAWPRFRYILLELWHSGDTRLDILVSEKREECRLAALKAFFQRELRRFAQEHGIDTIDIKAAKQKKIKSDCLSSFAKALSPISILDESATNALREALEERTESPIEDEFGEEESLEV